MRDGDTGFAALIEDVAMAVGQLFAGGDDHDVRSNLLQQAGNVVAAVMDRNSVDTKMIRGRIGVDYGDGGRVHGMAALQDQDDESG